MSTWNRGILGSVHSLWRYPIKSMGGEELASVEVTERGISGDRWYALVDRFDGKVATAKNPRKWPHLFEFHAMFVDTPRPGAKIPPVRITLPNGSVVTSEQSDLNQTLSQALNREVSFAKVRLTQPGDNASAVFQSESARAEEYWPDIEGLDYRDTVIDFNLLSDTFFDFAIVHLLTTVTLNRLSELYPQGRFDVRRFRPNIVVETAIGEKGFPENEWIGKTLALGDSVRLSITGSCPRCVMTTLAQTDLPQDPGILRTAAQHNQTIVGVYASVLHGGQLHQGDAIGLE